MKPKDILHPLPIWPVTLRDVPPLGLHVKKGEQDEAVLAALASYLGVSDANGFLLDVVVKPVAGDGLNVTGTARLHVRQACSVTLEPVDDSLVAPIDISYLPAHSMPEPEETGDDDAMPEFDPPDLLENDTVDLGTIAAEFLLLEVNPYPRKPGAEFGVQGDGGGESPFAALAKLKDRQ